MRAKFFYVKERILLSVQHSCQFLIQIPDLLLYLRISFNPFSVNYFYHKLQGSHCQEILCILICVFLFVL